MTSSTATPATSDSSTLYFGPWYRRSPFFEKTLAAGCSAYDIYNHMYLPGYYGDPIEEYWTLLNGVTIWDVSVEQIVEITGPDASAFTNTLTCRDLTKCAVGQGKYVLITAEDGGIVNDPVLLRVEADRWWLALADSDAGLWARGVSINSAIPPPPLFLKKILIIAEHTMHHWPDGALSAEHDRRPRQPRGVAAARWQGHVPAGLRRGRAAARGLPPARRPTRRSTPSSARSSSPA